ncbi:ABC transporter substrate-binding protein [Pseudonocardia acidicola]|uniref:ABC transporter substrate-binding protein n=1 Tax=Pseudonocardia acidicola TaxID=2724939 RepID=A0ABX1SD31_9PSEU|nr:ABC transporter substrate-binding protein [Pseudonocardia acidicola]NMH98164.1 ABC transporter substrate-binding protein [Pseudonocardia acidicola]
MIRAALVTPLSGPLAGYGGAGATALWLWAESAAEPVRLDVHDAHPDPVAALRRAERDHPDLLFAPYGSGPTRAVAAATERTLWNHGGARADAANLVDVLAPAQDYLVGALRLVAVGDPPPAGVVLRHGDTGFGRAVADGAAAAAGRLGLPVQRAVLPGPAPADTTDQVLLVAGDFAAERATAEALLPGRWRAAVFVGAGVDEVLAGLGERREGLFGPAQWLPETAPPRPDEGPTAAQFVAAYRRRTGAEPPYPAAQAFAAGLVAARCRRDAGTTDDAALLAAARALDTTTLFDRFRLDPVTGRQVGHRVLTVQWQDGRRRVVAPADRAEVAPRRGPTSRG